MTEARSPLDAALDLLVYAPVGFALTAAEEIPKLAAKGRAQVGGQVAMAKVVGQFAVAQGRKELSKRFSAGGEPEGEGDRAAGSSPSDAEPGPPAGSSSSGADPGLAAGSSSAGADPGLAAGSSSADPGLAAGSSPAGAEPAPLAGSRLSRPDPGQPPADADSGLDPGSGEVDFDDLLARSEQDGQPVGGPGRDPGRGGDVGGDPAESAAESPASPGGLGIPGYDSLAASQVVQRLAGLSAEELAAVGAYESAHRARRTILTRVDQLRTTEPAPASDERS